MVAAVGREVGWPVVATGELVTGAPIGTAPAGLSDGRAQLAVCDDAPQITMGVSCYPESVAQRFTLPPKTTKSSGGIPRTSNQSILASTKELNWQ